MNPAAIDFSATEPLPPSELARVAGLSYVSDDSNGITRRRNGKGFEYFDHSGTRIRDAHLLRRINGLAIPPAWRDVWICRYATGHLQATGRDDRDRKQYIYHSKWREASNWVKFWKLAPFGRCLPHLRRRLARDSAGKGLTRTRVLAGMVALLDVTAIRIGNEEYAKTNDSYGLATLRNRHLMFQDETACLKFPGKSGVRRLIVIEHPQLVRLLKECCCLKGKNVFQYVHDDGTIRPVVSSEVNDYLREVLHAPFTAKDFRTWKASALAAGQLYDAPAVPQIGRRRKIVRAAISKASSLLGNTVSVCQKYYVHPALQETYVAGTYSQYFSGFSARRRAQLGRDEQILARFLREWQKQSADASG